jgi:hypothetical protein
MHIITVQTELQNRLVKDGQDKPADRDRECAMAECLAHIYISQLSLCVISLQSDSWNKGTSKSTKK